MSNYEMAKMVSWRNKFPGPNQTIIQVPDFLLDDLEVFTSSNQMSVSDLVQEDKSTEFIPSITKWAHLYKTQLETSPGFICFQCRSRNYTDAQLRTLYGLLAMSFGMLDYRYGAFFDVKDQGLDYKKEAVPVSKTRASTGFHTDSTGKEYSPDIVGLLCLQAGLKGGESLLANGADLYCWMHDFQPMYLPFLEEPIVRDVITPGNVKNKEAILKNKFPVFSFDSIGLKFRYMRYWIITGHEKTGIPLMRGLQEAMDYIDEYLYDKNNSFKLKLSRGDMLFVNNRFLCHNRTAYEDWEKKDKKRIMVRTWISRLN